MSDRSYLQTVQRRAEESDAPQTLQRTLGASHLFLFGVGSIIGAGIFVTTGFVAAEHTGPAIVLSFVLAAAACLCAGLCYAEFATLAPVSGSAYNYVSLAFGRLPGWMIGWCLILEYLMAAANVAVGWSGYFVALLRSAGVSVPTAIATPLFGASVSTGLARTDAWINLPAVVLLASVTAALVRGAKLSAWLNAMLVTLKLAVIALFIVWGARFVDPANWRPFVPANSGEFGHFGWSGVIRGASIIFYAYLGFDAVSTAAREARNPQRNVPIGIIGSLLFCTVVYIAFSLVLTGLAPYRLLAAPNPVSVALDHAGSRLQLLKIAVELGAVIGLTSVALVLLYGQSRILYAMSQDGLVPSALGRIGARSRTPYVAIAVSGLFAVVLAGLFPIELLSELMSIGTLCAFVFVCGGVLFLRITQPELGRPFRTPFAPVVCSSGMLICAYLMLGLPLATWWRFLLWLLAGFAIYLAYGRARYLRAVFSSKGSGAT